MSSLARAFWPRWYRGIRRLEAVIDPIWRRGGLGNTVRVTIVGRRSGAPRTIYLGVLRVGDHRYLGHPDVGCAWTRNLDAAGGGCLGWPDGRVELFRAVLVEPGPERDAVIRATFRQHPFPATVFYWLSRRHLTAAGRFYRIEAGDPDASASPDGS